MLRKLRWGRNNMSNTYAAVSALIFAIVALMATQSMASRDWAAPDINECIVGSPCRFCSARNLGLRAIRLMPQWTAARREGMSAQMTKGPIKIHHSADNGCADECPDECT